MTKAIAPRQIVPAVIEPDDAPTDAKTLMQAIAMDIGKEIVAYIEVMYPQAIKATSSTFSLSVRNSIYNQIMAAFEFRGDVNQIHARLADRKAFRRDWVAAYRKIRQHPTKRDT